MTGVVVQMRWRRFLSVRGWSLISVPAPVSASVPLSTPVPASGVGCASAGWATVGIVTKPPLISLLVCVVVGNVVNLVCPLSPVLVVLYQLLHLDVPFLHATSLEMFPQQPS